MDGKKIEELSNKIAECETKLTELQAQQPTV